MTDTSPALLAWDRWLRQQTHRDDPVGEVARDYVDFCARRGRPASAGLMRVMVESEGTSEEFAALKAAWEEFQVTVPQPAPTRRCAPAPGTGPPPSGCSPCPTGQNLHLAQHNLVEDVNGRALRAERTTGPMTFVSETFGWTREEPDDDEEADR